MTTPVELSFPEWFAALVPRLGTVVRCHLPGAPVDARRRELVSSIVCDAAGNEALSRLHTDWLALLGPVELTEVDDEILAGACAALLAGPAGGLDLGDLPGEVTPEIRNAVLALVAHGAVTAATAQKASSLRDRVAGRAPRLSVQALGDLAAVMVAAPFVAPTAMLGVALGALGRLAPPAPVIDVEPDPNLLAQLLAETLPTWLGSAWGRTLVARIPIEVPIAVRAGLTGATVRVGRGRVQVRNGIAEDIWALFDGEIDALLRAGSHSLTRELRATRPRR